MYDKENKSYKYYVGYDDDDDDVIRSILIELPQMIGYYNHFETGGKGMSFKIFDKKVFKKDIKDISIINNKIKTSFYNNFNNNLVPEQKLSYDCFSLISLGSIVRKNDDICYAQVCLEERQYRIKKIKKKRWLNKTFDSDSDIGTDSEPDSDPDYNNESEKSSNKSDNNESEKSVKKSG